MVLKATPTFTVPVLTVATSTRPSAFKSPVANASGSAVMSVVVVGVRVPVPSPARMAVFAMVRLVAAASRSPSPLKSAVATSATGAPVSVAEITVVVEVSEGEFVDGPTGAERLRRSERSVTVAEHDVDHRAGRR